MNSQYILPYCYPSHIWRQWSCSQVFFYKQNIPRSFHLPHVIQFLVLPPFLPLFWGWLLSWHSRFFWLWPTLPLPLVCNISPHSAGTFPSMAFPCTPRYCILLFICGLYSFSPECLSHSWSWATQAHWSREGSMATSPLKASWVLPPCPRQNQTALPPSTESQHQTDDPLICG